MIDDNFVKNLPQDPVLAAGEICRKVVQTWEQQGSSAVNIYEEYLSALGIFSALAEAYGLKFELPELTGDRSQNIQQIYSFMRTIGTDIEKEIAKLTVQRVRDEYVAKIGRGFGYEFSDGDLKKIQELINELRNQISGSQLFEDKHRERLLKKLESLQSELHKRMSNLDKLWSLIGEAGIALGKLGKEAKPFVDLIKEIIFIVWRTQARSEELPTDTPIALLKGDDENQV